MERSTFNTEQEELDIKELIRPYLKRWPWFVLGVAVALLACVIYLRYTAPSYNTNATIIIKDSNETSLAGELAPFSQLGLFNRVNQAKLQNEIAILRSRRILEKVIRQLDLNTTYSRAGNVIASELYPEAPFKLQWLDSLFKQGDLLEHIPGLTLSILDRDRFELETVEGQSLGAFSFNQPIALPSEGDRTIPVFSIQKTTVFDPNTDVGETYFITYRSTQNLALSYQKRLEIEEPEDRSNLIKISLISSIPQKARDFINELIRQYDLDASRDEKEIARSTAAFIDERLQLIATDLDSVERSKEAFKELNRLSDIDMEAQLVLSAATEYSNQQVDYFTRLQMVDYLLEYLGKNTTSDLLPANLGLEGAELINLITEYNRLVLDGRRLSTNSTGANPVIVNIERQLEGLRESIIGSLNNQRESLQLALQELSRQESVYNSRLSQVPAQERVFRDIVRQQEIKEQLYIFLLTQREEAAIKIAAAVQKVKVVDAAFTDKAPVAPKRTTLFLGAFMAGLILPFLVIYGREALNTRIENRKDIERELPDFTIAGEVPLIKDTDRTLIKENDRGILAESFRIMRTNLEYLFLNKDALDRSQTILVTSSVQGEGKTLLSFNLALTYSYTGKKVALVGGDIRNPQLQRYLPGENTKSIGLINYVVDKELDIKDVITHSSYNNLDIILSGPMPPNPAEMLMQDRVGQLFKQLGELYDMVVIDSAPCLLVTDTLLISKYADITLYSVKAHHTDKRLLEFPAEMVKDGRLKNVALVLNAVKMMNFGYGNKYGYGYRYGYGYGYGQNRPKRSFWRRWLPRW